MIQISFGVSGVALVEFRGEDDSFAPTLAENAALQEISPHLVFQCKYQASSPTVPCCVVRGCITELSVFRIVKYHELRPSL